MTSKTPKPAGRGLFILVFSFSLLYTLGYMVVRMRHTRGHTRNRRSHHALKIGKKGLCPDCNSPKESHKACLNCGKYKGRQVLNVLAKVEKKEKKEKKKRIEQGKKEKDNTEKDS